MASCYHDSVRSLVRVGTPAGVVSPRCNGSGPRGPVTLVSGTVPGGTVSGHNLAPSPPPNRHDRRPWLSLNMSRHRATRNFASRRYSRNLSRTSPYNNYRLLFPDSPKRSE